MDENTIRLLIVIGGFLLSAAAFFIGQSSARKAEGEKAGAIASDIGYIKAGNDDIKKELREIRDSQSAVLARVGVLEEKGKSLQRQIDELKKGGAA